MSQGNQKRTSWKYTSKSGGAVESKATQRWIVTVSLTLLLILLAYCLWWLITPKAHTYFLSVPTGQSHRLSFPPIPGGGRDFDSLHRAAEADSLSVEDISPGSRSSDVTGISLLANRLASLENQFEARDRLIVHVSAHGMSSNSDPAAAVLLGRAFRVDEDQAITNVGGTAGTASALPRLREAIGAGHRALELRSPSGTSGQSLSPNWCRD